MGTREKEVQSLKVQEYLINAIIYDLQNLKGNLKINKECKDAGGNRKVGLVHLKDSITLITKTLKQLEV